MIPGQTIDATALPEVGGIETRSPLWWGMVWTIAILTTVAALLAASYFYLRRNFDQWPPPQVSVHPPMDYPLPDLALPTLNLALLILSCAAAYVVDRSARRMRQWPLRLGLLIVVGLGVISLMLRYAEFNGLHFRWDDNAYGSIVWAILVFHLICLFTATVEMLVMGLWGWLHPLDEKHALDVSIMSLFWYWMVGVWVVLYLIVYVSPRFI